MNLTRRKSSARKIPTVSDVLSPRHVALASESHARVAARGVAITISFFARLHEAVPRLRRMFPYDDLEKRALAKELFDLVMVHLHSTGELRALLERMGRRGLLDGVSPKDVAGLGTSLVATIGEFDEGWNVDVERAWAGVFGWATTAVERGASARRGAR